MFGWKGQSILSVTELAGGKKKISIRHSLSAEYGRDVYGK